MSETFAWKWVEPIQQNATVEPPSRGFGEVPPPVDNLVRLRPAQYVRREFTVTGPVKSAVAYATSHGFYRLYCNAREADDRLFTPEVTPFQKLLYYQKYDLTAHLREGVNAVGAILTDGWHIGRIGLTGDSCQYADRLAFLFHLVITYEDGRVQTLSSDSGFRSSTGAIDYSDIYIGERFDARKEPKGWCLPGFDDSSWQNVTETDFPEELEEQTQTPILRHEHFVGSRLVTPSGQTVFDVGQVIAGVERVTVKGKPGSVLRLEHAEILEKDGNFRRNIVGRNKDQTDYYIIGEDGCGVYEPIGSYHGFRYLMAVCEEGEAEVTQMEAFAVRTVQQETASFSCSDERLNRLWQNILWSQRGNMISVPTDCPQRERSGFTGDMQIFIRAACWNMDIRSFVRNWLRTVRLEQKPSGEVTIIAPNFPGLERMQMGMSGTNSSSGWGDAIVIVPWELYRFYGDKSVLEENYEAMKAWVAYEQAKAAEAMPEDVDPADTARVERNRYLWNTGFHFGDWLIPSMSGKNPFMAAQATLGIFGTAYFANSCRLLSQIASVLGREDDSAHYLSLFRKIADAFTVEYYLGSGRMACPYQGGYVVALAFDLLPEAERAAAAETLCAMIAENGDRLDTGFLSVSHLMDVLCRFGHRDLAYRLLFQTKCPSWLYEVEQGATTVWESWNAVLPDGTTTSSSYNHYAFGCVADWMMRFLAGIDSEQPGFARTVVRPRFDCGLTAVSASYESVRGTIAVRWNRTDTAAVVGVTVPAGIEAFFEASDGARTPLRPGENRLEIAL